MNGISILILDDEDMWIGKHTSKLQNKGGYNTVSTSYAEQALNKIKQDDKYRIKAAIIDEILLNPDNPPMKQDMQGTDVVKEIKKIRKDILCLIVSCAPEKEKSGIDALRKAETFENIADKVFFKYSLEKDYNKLINYLVNSIEKNKFYKEGDFWSISYAGETIKLKDTVGLNYIYHLISNPNKGIYSSNLIRIVQVIPIESNSEHSNMSLAQLTEYNLYPSEQKDVGDLIDVDAIEEYKKRLYEIKEDKEKAQKNDKFEELEQLEAEEDFIAKELKNVIDKNGHSRKFNTQGERDRQSVSKAIHRSLKKINKSHKKLATHLSGSLLIGKYISYKPKEHIFWETAKF